MTPRRFKCTQFRKGILDFSLECITLLQNDFYKQRYITFNVTIPGQDRIDPNTHLCRTFLLGISVLGNKVHVGHHLCLRHRKDKLPKFTKSFRKHALFLYVHIIKYIYNISIMPLSLRIMCFLENVFN